MQPLIKKNIKSPLKRLLKPLLGTIAALVSVGVSFSPALAGDPFRTSNPRAIGNDTEAAFEALFRDGDYPTAIDELDKALRSDPNEPLVYALLASITYLNSSEGIPAEFSNYATRTRETAQALLTDDPLRGNLYIAVGYFLEGAYSFLSDGAIRGTPAALNKLQQTFDYLDKAAAVNSSDPELNSIKGYMDMMLAVALPFANAAPALERLEEYGGPAYLSWRGVAVGHRDAERPEAAMGAVDQAIEAAPDNPELYYLKAQIFVEQRLYAQSLDWFDRALDDHEQLLSPIVRQICRERGKALERAVRDGASTRSAHSACS